MKKRSALHVFGGFLAVAFALSATGYLAFKEHEQANREPATPQKSAVSPTAAGLAPADLPSDEQLDEFGFPAFPTSGEQFFFGSQSGMVAPPEFSTGEANEREDTFLPSSKRRNIDPRVLVTPAQPDRVENE